jgi:EmrB/QacA subfamily drug resistance transporter
VAFGPLIGGFLLAHFWWGSVFLVNVPVVAIALLGGHYFLPSSKDETAPSLDPLGAVLSTSGLVAVLWGLIEAPSHGWGATPIVAAFAVGLGLLSVFIAWELRSDHPMLEIRFFANRRFSAANVAVTFVFFAMFGSSFLITQLLQSVLGYSALKAGFAMLPIAIPLMILGPLSARLAERFGTKAMVAGGLTLVATGLAWLGQIQMGDGFTSILFPMVVLATGMGLTMAPATESIMGSLPREKAGVGSAMNDTTRQVGGALGVAVIGSVLASVYRPKIHAALAHSSLAQAASLPGSTGAEARTALAAIGDQVGAAHAVVDKAAAAGHPLPDAASILHNAHSAFLSGFGNALLIGAGVALAGAIIALLFLPARAIDHDEVMSEELPGLDEELVGADAADVAAVPAGAVGPVDDAGDLARLELAGLHGSAAEA